MISLKEPILFSCSIADNIAYGANTGQQVTNDDILDAAVQANAYGFIKSFPNGFDTVVGERGQMLSGLHHRWFFTLLVPEWTILLQLLITASTVIGPITSLEGSSYQSTDCQNIVKCCIFCQISPFIFLANFP